MTNTQNNIMAAIVVAIVCICATVAASLDALTGEALAGILGAAIGGGAVTIMPGRSRL